MISLETAKNLKAAGLVWDPQYGDRFVIPAIFIEGLSGLIDDRLLMAYRANELEDNWEEFIRVNIFFPRLDQLLSEIEKRGYNYTFKSPDEHIAIYRFWIDNRKGKSAMVQADTPEEAAGEVLLRILEQKEGE